MTFANDIRRLSQSLAEAQENRVSALENINRRTAQQLSTFRSDRAAMSTQQRRELADDMTGLRNTIRAMQENTVALLGEIETARENMAQVQTQELAEHTEAVRNAARQLRDNAEGFVATIGQNREKSAALQAKHLNQETNKLRSGVSNFRKSINTAQDAMATKQRAQLNAAVNDLRATTAEILKNFEAELAQMATEQDAELTQDMQTLQAQVNALRENAVQFIADADKAHQEAAAALRQDLFEHRTGLEATVASIRAQFRNEHDQIRKDHAEARLIWTRLNTLLQNRRAKQKGQQSESPAPVVEAPAPVSPPAPVASVAEVSVAPDLTAATPRDDLTLIHGIGHATQRRLNEAGIWTFVQLAAADEEQLRQTLGQLGRLAKVDEWIALAREMTG